MAAAEPGIEIERKFLVAEPPGTLERAAASDIRQGYLVIGADGGEVRVRERDGETTLTVKQGGGRTRTEEEIALARDDFERLWPLTEGRRVEKRRYELEHGDLTIEVDVYRGALEGLIVAEIEFPDEEAAERLEQPAWLARELTGDPAFSNQRLAIDGLPESFDPR